MRQDLLSVLVDVGGQGCRAVVIDADGHWLARAERKPMARAGHDAPEPESIVDAVRAAINDAANQTGHPHRIGRAALAVERGTVVCWDRLSGETLSPLLSWQDRRGLSGIDTDPAAARKVRESCGLRLSPFGGASKLAWCLAHLVAVQRAAQEGRLAWGPLGSFLVHRLTEERALLVDDSLAQRTLLWSRQRFDWDEDLLGLFGLPDGHLPTVVDGRHSFGHLSEAGCQAAVELLTGDQNVVPYADGNPDPDTCYINLGTGAFLLRPCTGPPATEHFQTTLLARDSGGLYALEGTVHGAAAALNWLADQPEPEQKPAQSGAVFRNTVGGLGSPWWTGGPEPTFVEVAGPGLNGGDARTRAVLESIAFLVRVNFERINRLVGPPRRIRVSGGLSNNSTLCQLLADVLGCEVECRSEPEATLLGLGQRLLGHGHRSPVRQRHRPRPAANLDQRYQYWLDAMPPVPD